MLPQCRRSTTSTPPRGPPECRCTQPQRCPAQPPHHTALTPPQQCSYGVPRRSHNVQRRPHAGHAAPGSPHALHTPPSGSCTPPPSRPKTATRRSHAAPARWPHIASCSHHAVPTQLLRLPNAANRNTSCRACTGPAVSNFTSLSCLKGWAGALPRRACKRTYLDQSAWWKYKKCPH